MSASVFDPLCSIATKQTETIKSKPPLGARLLQLTLDRSARRRLRDSFDVRPVREQLAGFPECRVKQERSCELQYLREVEPAMEMLTGCEARTRWWRLCGRHLASSTRSRPSCPSARRRHRISSVPWRKRKMGPCTDQCRPQVMRIDIRRHAKVVIPAPPVLPDRGQWRRGADVGQPGDEPPVRNPVHVAHALVDRELERDGAFWLRADRLRGAGGGDKRGASAGVGVGPKVSAGNRASRARTGAVAGDG